MNPESGKDEPTAISSGPPQRTRLFEVDRVTALAIILVVIGHIVARQPPLDAQWYLDLKFLIYQFHMPLFMFCSGLVFTYTYSHAENLSALWQWITKKVQRLAPAFLLIGLAIIAGKMLTSQFLHVDNAPSNFGESVVRLLFIPTTGAAGSLWYIYVLLEFNILFPVLYRVLGHRMLPIFVLTLLMHATHLVTALPQFMMVDGIFEYALYFHLGGCASMYYAKLIDFVKTNGWYFVGLFLLSFGSIFLLDEIHSKTVVGLASIPALMFLVGVKGGAFDRLLLFVSCYTFTIYLLNTIFIGVTKGVLLNVLPWDGLNFLFYFPVLAAAGMLGPIILYRYVLSRHTYMKRIFR